jgi:hypothetical protein
MNSNQQSDLKQRMENFFNNEISFYVLPDIDKLTNEIRPDENGQRGCTVPLAMMLFSLIDVFGFLIRPDENANKRNTRRNFEYFLSQSGYLPETYRSNWNMILRIFRHKVTHQFFPGASGVAKAGSNVPLVFRHGGNHILNVDILSADVVQAINQIRANIISGNDSNLILRMNNRIDELAHDDYDDLAEFNESA